MTKAKLKNQFFNTASGEYIKAGTIVEVVSEKNQYFVCHYKMCYHIIPKGALEFENEKQTTIYDFIGGKENA